MGVGSGCATRLWRTLKSGLRSLRGCVRWQRMHWVRTSSMRRPKCRQITSICSGGESGRGVRYKLGMGCEENSEFYLVCLELDVHFEVFNVVKLPQNA